MKFQLGWLKEHVDVREDVGALSRRLTSLGFAVDGVEGSDDATVFDLDVTTNRVDAMNHVGLARELAAALRVPLRLPDTTLAESSERAADVTSVEVEDADLCPRYVARVVRGVKVGKSPAWMADRLAACGVRPINVLVDVTNYVLLELGQPLHAFDLDLLAGRRIVVRRARPGEKLTTLDGQERALEREMLMIADAQQAVAVAGVMGGANTEIRDATTDVLIESAAFAPASIRRTSRALGMHTEASHRFERGTDWDVVPLAADRAAQLIAELAGGVVLAGRIDVASAAPPLREVRLRAKRLELLCGISIPASDVERILAALGLEVVGNHGDGWTVRVPRRRGDVALEVDLIEEVLRHHGFEQVGHSLPAFRAGAAPRKPWETSLARLRAALAASGHQQAIHWAFDDPASQRRWAIALDAGSSSRLLDLANPMAENLGTLRATLMPALLRSAAHSLRRGEEDVRLFEEASLYLRREKPGATPVEERPALAIVASGASGPRHFLHPSKPVDILTVKGALLDALVAAGASMDDLSVVPATIPGCAPGAAEIRLAGRRIGWLGRVHPDELEPLEVKAPVFAAEVDLSDVIARGPGLPAFSPPSRYPGVARDLCVLVDRALPLDGILSTVKALRAAAATEGAPIESFELIDRYLGAGVPDGKVSLTFTVSYRRADRTLTQDEVDSQHQVLVGALARDVGATLRS